MNINDYVGKRVLLKLAGNWAHGRQVCDEYRVLETSPSGNWVKLMNLHGNKFWMAITDVSFIEELKDLRAERLSGEPE